MEVELRVKSMLLTVNECMLLIINQFAQCTYMLQLHAEMFIPIMLTTLHKVYMVVTLSLKWFLHPIGH